MIWLGIYLVGVLAAWIYLTVDVYRNGMTKKGLLREVPWIKPGNLRASILVSFFPLPWVWPALILILGLTWIFECIERWMLKGNS